MPGFLNRGWVLGSFLIVFTFAAYQPAWNGKPIWDDDAHITKPALRSMEGLAHIWTQPGETQQYYPLVHSVFWLEDRLWGGSTTGYHLLNILLHVFSALLLVNILRFLRVPGAWLAGAVFALHPVQAESVAWISELKNTLSAFFFLGAALAYLKFDAERKRTLYAGALTLFLLGLMSKSVVAALPVALLVVFWWKRGSLSWKRDAAPLLPFFIVGIASGLFTVWMERAFIIGKDITEFNFSVIERCLIAGRAFWFYPGKLFWPAELIFIYPRWNINPGIWWQYLYPAAALLVAGALWTQRNKRRGLVAGSLFFAVTLFPALGFVNVYPFRFSFVADHFQYLASIGPITLVAAGVSRAVAAFVKAQGRILKPALFAIIPALLGVLTWRQSGMYADAGTLYQATIERNPACWMAHNNLGNVLLQSGRETGAIEHFKKALELKPDYILAATNLGDALVQSGKMEEGIAQYRKALEIDPTSIAAYIDLGNAYMQDGQTKEGIAQYRRVLTLDSTFVAAYYDLGNAFMQSGLTEEGIAQYRKALEIDTNYSAAHVNLGRALMQQDRANEAAGHFQKALKIDPGLTEAHSGLGYALMQMGRADQAIGHFQKALEHDPNNLQGLSSLRDAFLKTGQLNEAIQTVQKALAAAASAGRDSLAKGIAGDLEKLRQLKLRSPGQ